MRSANRTAIRTTGALGAALALGAAPAVATVLSLPCYYDDASGTLAMPGTPAAENGDIVEPYTLENGFVAWDWWGREITGTVPKLSVVEHCATGRALVVSYGTRAPVAAHDAWRDKVFGETPATLRQIGEAVADLGGSARTGKSGYGDCACTQMGY